MEQQSMLLDVADPEKYESQITKVEKYSKSWCPPPTFMMLISFVQVYVFLVYYETDQGTDKDIWKHCAGCITHHNQSIQPGPLIFSPQLRHEAWRFVTYMFLHAGLKHLIANCVIQLFVGFPLELVHKTWRIAPLYLLAVISGALLQYATDTRTFLFGASAGAYALIFAYIADVILNLRERPLSLRDPIICFYIFIEIIYFFFNRFRGEQIDDVSDPAHIAGALTGLLFGYAILYNVVENRIKTIIRRICLAYYVIFLSVLIVIAVFREPYSEPIYIKMSVDTISI